MRVSTCMRGYQTNPNQKALYKNNWPKLFKSIKVMSSKENLKNCPRLEETKVTGQLNAVQNLGLDPGHKKDSSGTNGKIWMKSVDQLILLFQC